MKFQKKQENIVGTCQGIYDVLYECDFKSNDGHRMFHIKCSECGWETDMQMHRIKRTKKCRHVRLEGNYIFSYYWENKRLHKIFDGMRARCYDKTNKSYQTYGGKGIRICEEWLKNPRAFETWAINNGYKNNLTIDRINSDKDYCPENCRWVTFADNAKYKSTTHLIEVDGVTHTGRDWALILKVGKNRINIFVKEYSEEIAEEFIRKRLQDMDRPSKYNNWLKTYGIIS